MAETKGRILAADGNRLNRFNLAHAAGIAADPGDDHPFALGGYCWT